MPTSIFKPGFLLKKIVNFLLDSPVIGEVILFLEKWTVRLPAMGSQNHEPADQSSGVG